MLIDRVFLFIGREEVVAPAQIEVTNEDLEAGNPVHGQLNGYSPDDLKPYLKAFDEKRLYARVRGRDYRVVNLSLDGKFTLQRMTS